jgi:quercetin dioxygenase-like cupin family protein
MRRWSHMFSLALVLFLSLVGLGSTVVHAQDSTPASGPMEEEGVTYEPLGFLPGVTLPSSSDVVAVRITIDPGATTPLDASDPSGGVLIVESGTFTVHVEETGWTVSRGAALQQAMNAGDDSMPGVIEQVTMGEEATLEAGDVAYVPGSVSGEIRNDGDEPAVGLAVIFAPGGMMEMGTPTP